METRCSVDCTIKSIVIFIALSSHFPVVASQGNNENHGNKIKTGSSDYNAQNSRLDEVGLFNKGSYDYQVKGRLRVEVKDVTTSTIDVRWSLPKMMFNDSTLESNVVCETSNGYSLSRKHVTSRATHRFENLKANTSYFVCVYMLEKSNSSNTKVLHYNCHLSTTEALIPIPSLRTDSIVAVVLTLGYIIAMIIIGYATWRWKRKRKEQDEAKQKLAIEDYDDDDDEEEGMINGGLGDNYKRGVGSSGSYGYSGASTDEAASRKERDSLIGSSRHGLNNSDRARSGSRGNNVGSVTFSESEVVLERKSNSAEDVNGCLDFKRNSRGSMVKLTDLAENGNKTQEKKRPKSQSLEDSPVKITEITF